MAIVVDRKTKLTYEDYRQFPEDGRRHEIIDGDHYVSAAPSVYHQRVLSRLFVQLYRLIGKQPSDFPPFVECQRGHVVDCAA